MRESLGHRLRVLFAAAVAIALVLSVAGCGNDDDSAEIAGTIASAQALDSAGLHGIHESIVGGVIPANAQSTAVKMQTVALITHWPTEDLKKKSVALAALLGTMADTLDSENPDAMKVMDAAAKAHAGFHEFSEAVWAYLENEAGVKASAETQQTEMPHMDHN
jgi:hypothetical protein